MMTLGMPAAWRLPKLSPAMIYPFLDRFIPDDLVELSRTPVGVVCAGAEACRPQRACGAARRVAGGGTGSDGVMA